MSYFTVQHQHLCGVTEENYNEHHSGYSADSSRNETVPPKHGAAAVGVVRHSRAEECKGWQNGRQNEYLK
jgi:hypothetical protein